jgi:L-fuconolactonase
VPQFAIVDTHLHIFDPTRLAYPWHGSIPQLDRPFLLSDFDEHRATVDVERMVFLECDVATYDRLAEAQWVTQEALADARIQAIVAAAPLENGAAARPDLEALAELPLVHGIRRLIQDEPDDDFCVQPDFIAGVKLLPELGFTFDICIQHRHMANAVRLARSCPEVRFILDYIGKPGIGEGVLEPWRRHLRELADLPNVHCKVSGLVTAADHAASRAASPAAMMFA